MATPRPRTGDGEKNLISRQLIALRKQHHISQRELAHKMQLAGYDIDKNVITRIETNQRYVTDIEVRGFAQLFGVSYQYLMDGKD
ncbi:MAG: helix-turn-helix transcriptional regulator [Eubacteriales bacterium]|nr:helix-turn-helix transcriptional regulator [Eubacteriales bacterium]